MDDSISVVEEVMRRIQEFACELINARRRFLLFRIAGTEREQLFDPVQNEAGVYLIFVKARVIVRLERRLLAFG